MSFRFRILLTVCVLFGSCLAITITSYYQLTSSHEHDQAVRQITSNTIRILEDINTFIAERNADMAAMATARIWFDGTPINAVTARLHEYRNIHSSFSRICVLARDGTLLVDSSSPAAPPLPVEALRLNHSAVADGFVLTHQFPQLVIFHRPVKNPAGTVYGTLIGVIPISRIFELIRGFESSGDPNARIELITVDGHLLFSNSNDSRTDLDQAVDNWPELASFITQLQAMQLHVQQFETTTRLTVVAAAPLTATRHDVPWVLRITADKQVLFANAVVWAQKMAILGTLFLLLSMTLLWFIVAGLSQPVALLIRQTRRLEQGDFTELQELSTRRDEFGTLMSSFRNMAQRLRESVADLKRNEQRWQFALEGPGSGMWDWNLQSGEVYFSPQWQQLLGYRPGEIQGTIEEWYERILADDRPQCEAHLHDYLQEQSGGHFQCEQRLRCKDGDYKWFALNGVVWERDAHARPVRLIGTLRDITASKRLEQEHAREAQLNAVFSDLATEMLAAHTLNEVCEQVFRAALQLTASPSGFIGHIDERSGNLILPALSQDICEQRPTTDREVVFREFRGLWGWVLNHRQPLLCNDPAHDPRTGGIPSGHQPIRRFLSVPVCLDSVLVGQIAVANADRNYSEADLQVLNRLATVFALGISQQKVNQALLASEEKFRHVVEATPDAIIIHRDDEIVFVNDNACLLTGAASRADLLGTLLSNLLPPNSRPLFEERIELLRQHQQPLMLVDEQLLRLDGNTIAVEITSVPITLQGKSAILTIVRNIGERKQTEEQLRQALLAADTANQAKSHFLAVMSHEIRTPMNGIVGLAQLLETTTLTDEQQEYLSGIHTSAELLLALIDDILDLSRIEAGKIDLDENPVLVRPFFREVVGLHLAKARSKGLQLQCSVAEDVPEILVCDQLRLKQILTNLLGNAVKFTEQGNITVTVVAVEPPAAAQGYLQITVRDTGIGMDAATCGRLFQSFSQAGLATTRKYGGSGLGLAISKRLAALMEGDIHVSSQPGVGSTFQLTLPLRREPAAVNCCAPTHAFPATSLPRTWTGVKPRVLLVEDNDSNRKLMGIFLGKLGITYQEALNGAEAVQLLQPARHTCDVVLMDLEMPVMDGFTATRLIRTAEAEHGGHLPIIALTAHAIKGDREKCLAAGFDGYLSKPLLLSALVEELQRVLPHA